ncbi:MAG TPA: PilW family protein [Rhodanobacteraceae bacterium]
MNARHVLSRVSHSHGFTLVELMVAMLLGLIVIAGVSSVFLANLRSYHTNTALSDVQSNARIAFELMARDVRQAGLTGCNSMSNRVANVLNNQSTDWWANWNNAVHGYGPGDVDPAITSSVPARAASTDSLMIIEAAGDGISVASDKEPAANFKLNATSTNLATGDVIMVCDPDHATIAQITDYNSNNVTVVHNTGTSSPGNCSKGLGYPTECTTNGNLYTFGPNSQISMLTAHDWYIGHNPAGGLSLYRVALANQAGTPTPQAQEMVRNVTDMQITYHQGNAATFVAAGSVTDWSQVNAVHITFTLQSTDQRAGTNGKALVRSFATTITIRNRV